LNSSLAGRSPSRAMLHEMPETALEIKERLMGFEPTTFCMASSFPVRAEFQRVPALPLARPLHEAK
jgi:hypothetical protein